MTRKEHDKHHRKPRSQGGSNKPHNISIVPRSKHMAWHLLFQNWTAEEIAAEINSLWLDSDYFMVAVPRKPQVVLNLLK